MKLLKLSPKSYVLNCVDPSTMSATEALFFEINNIMVFEETVFKQHPAVVTRFKEVLDDHDWVWLIAFFFNKVYVEETGAVIFNTNMAIYYKCILEVLLEYKYAPREGGNEEYPLPELPPEDDLDPESLNIVYKRYAQNRIDQYNEVVYKFITHNE